MSEKSNTGLVVGFILFIGVSIAAGNNIASQWSTGIEIHNHWDQPIDYAIKSSPNEALVKFQEVKKWMEDKRLTEGDTCAFGWQQSPYCDLHIWYADRIENTISDLQGIQTSKPSDSALVMQQIKTRHEYSTDKGGWEVTQPPNLNQWLRYRSANVWLGLWDLLSYVVIMLAFLVAFTLIFT